MKKDMELISIISIYNSYKHIIPVIYMSAMQRP